MSGILSCPVVCPEQVNDVKRRYEVRVILVFPLLSKALLNLSTVRETLAWLAPSREIRLFSLAEVEIEKEMNRLPVVVRVKRKRELAPVDTICECFSAAAALPPLASPPCRDSLLQCRAAPLRPVMYIPD